MKQKFQETLDKSEQELLECQTQKKLTSCFKCEKILECDIRKKYISNVYRFLNDGNESSDFDF